MKRFSLILCTINRDQVVREYFESLVRQQDPPSFEVILIDQNKDDRLLPIMADFEDRFRSAVILPRPAFPMPGISV